MDRGWVGTRAGLVSSRIGTVVKFSFLLILFFAQISFVTYDQAFDYRDVSPIHAILNTKDISFDYVEKASKEFSLEQKKYQYILNIN
jgi:hypothetical protein